MQNHNADPMLHQVCDLKLLAYSLSKDMAHTLVSVFHVIENCA